MKIVTKIAVAYGILVALILAALSYQVSLIHRMQSVNQNLAEMNVRTALTALQWLRDLEQLEEFTRKYLVTGGDPGYGVQIRELRTALSRTLGELRVPRLSKDEEEEVGRLEGLWRRFDSSSRPETLRSMPPPEMEVWLSGQLDQLRQIRTQVRAVIRTNRQAIETHAAESARDARHAERVSLVAALVALGLSVLVSLLMIRSISGRLRHLAEGTRAVAEGKLFYQLDGSGNDEFAQLARDFNVMTRRLNELDEMKKDFVSHVSHEFKTPLASIQETTRLLLDEIPGPLSEKQKRLLDLSLQSGNRLSTLIGNLLDLSQMEAGVLRYDFRKHDLTALIRLVLAEFEAPSGSKGVRLEARLPERRVEVSCDGDRILQVLGNLLGNALKFSPGGAAITVLMDVARETPQSLPGPWRGKVPEAANGIMLAMISVTDSGPGVPAVDRERVFTKFYHRGKMPGTGLGLSISRTIVEAHRGAIWVEDNSGGGSVFHVLLPVDSMVGEASGGVTSAPV